MTKQLKDLLSRPYAFNIYLAHGGTNWGLYAATGEPIRPMITSYDWGAPINEHGSPNENYFNIRSQLKKYYDEKKITDGWTYEIPEIPA